MNIKRISIGQHYFYNGAIVKVESIDSKGVTLSYEDGFIVGVASDSLHLLSRIPLSESFILSLGFSKAGEYYILVLALVGISMMMMRCSIYFVDELEYLIA